MWEIELVDEQSLLSIDRDWFKEVAERTLAEEQVTAAEIVIAFVDDEAIHAVNREHLQHDYPTDVISFVYSADESGKQISELGIAPRGRGLVLDGELIVSVETAIRMAAEHGWTPTAELALYLVHGLLHLCGYDDLTPNEQRRMRQREQEIMSIWNLTPQYESIE